jgi:signal transduction histidine kinase
VSDDTFFGGPSDTQFANPASAGDADRWIRGELTANFLRATRGSYLLCAILMPAMAALSWSGAPLWELLCWLGAGSAVTGGLWLGERAHARSQAVQAPQARARALRAYVYVWIASALVWGLSVHLFFERAPIGSQLTSWLILAGAATYPLNNLALRPRLLQRYVQTLLGCAALCVLVRTLTQGVAEPFMSVRILALLAFHGWVLLRAGRHIHETARHGFELLFHNHILIQSLTRQRQAAVAAVAMKNRFLASAAHDMRQPVLALSLYADWLRNEPELVGEIAPKIVRATHAVNTLFDSLFDLARIDAGQVHLHIEAVDVTQLLHDLELQYRPLAEAKGLRFRARAVPGTVLTDPVRVRRMLGNLLSNAIKYTPRGGVLLAARRGRDGLRVEVRDTGIGIAHENLRDVFLEFYKVADHLGTSDGFGLGLAIVARLSRVLGHPVSVQSSVGRGSVFRVALHDADPAQAQARMSGAVVD